MSRKLSVRLPDELAAMIDERVLATGKKITDVVVELAAYGLQRVNALPTPDRVDRLSLDVADATVSFTACGAGIENPDVRSALEDVAKAGATVMRASQVEQPDAVRCPACGARLIPWGPSKRCQNCKRNW